MPADAKTITRSCIASLQQLYRRDPKRSTLVAAVTVVMLGLSTRLVLPHGPAAAHAFPASPVTSQNIEPSPRTPPRIDPAALQQWLNVERHQPRRNLFATAQAISNSAPISVTTVTASQTAKKIRGRFGHLG